VKNPLKEIKRQQQAAKVMAQLAKIKEQSVVEYKWFGLACCSGIVNDISKVINPLDTIAETKKTFDSVHTEEELDAMIVNFKDSMKNQGEKVLGKFYIKQLFKPFNKDGDKTS
jgi:hypothetical protein